MAYVTEIDAQYKDDNLSNIWPPHHHDSGMWEGVPCQGGYICTKNMMCKIKYLAIFMKITHIDVKFKGIFPEALESLRDKFSPQFLNFV